MKLYYDPNLKTRARELRKQGILSEVILWQYLKGKQIGGFQFTRQKPIEKYIVDFYCNKLKLVIEIDGITHEDKVEYDKERLRYLESLGLTVLRFYDNDVRNDVEAVITVISEWIKNKGNDNPLNPP